MNEVTLMNNSGTAKMFQNEHERLLVIERLRGYERRNKISLEEFEAWRNDEAAEQFIMQRGW